MDGVVELSFSGGGSGVEDDDPEVMVVPSPSGSTGTTTTTTTTKKKRNVFQTLKLIGKDNKASYPFLETPDEREEMMYICLMQSKLFVTVKGKGVLRPGLWPSKKSINRKTRPPISLSSLR
jgi:hypothetical protein